MNDHFRYFCVLLYVLLVFSGAPTQAEPKFPSTENFMNTLGTCAGGMNLKLSADLMGSVRSLYEEARTQGLATLENAPELLRLIPEADRRAVYEIYVACIMKLLAPPEQARPERSSEGCSFNQCRSDSGRADAEAAMLSCRQYTECDQSNPLAFSMLGQAYRQLGHFSSAEKAFERQMILAQKLNDKGITAHAYYNLASLYLRMRAFEYSESLLNLSIKIHAEQHDNVALGANYKLLADVSYFKGELPAAEENFQRAIELFTRIGRRVELGQTYIGLGYTKLRLNDREAACQNFRKARDAFAAGKFDRGISSADEHISKNEC
jgi:tetratricopeptide (TPR) repeat protein